MSTLIIGGCGYIGSVLYRTLSQTEDVMCFDTERRGNPGEILHVTIDYGRIGDVLYNFDDIILLAGHSSVADATSDPDGAFANNVTAFHRLLTLLSPDQRLVYASSSSVYSGFGATVATENAQPGNLYDLSKFVGDALANLSEKRTYGLRFGTVNGPSPNMRSDIMLNKMVVSALMTDKVHISNPKVRRPILGINDLCRAILAILDGDGAPGIYNLASFTATVAHLGATVADKLDASIVLGEPTPTYDFSMECTKFQEAYDFQFEETAASIVDDLVGDMNGGVER